MLRKILEHPLTKGLNLDDPYTTALRRQIIQGKPFLKKIFDEWYWLLVKYVAGSRQPILELGSGAGFLLEFLPKAITSDIMCLPHIDLVCNALRLPFAGDKLGGILMSNVLHHLPDPKTFFAEATRCVSLGGTITMIEPWKNPWSSFVYSRLHHEPFDPQAVEWGCKPGRPLTNANGAIPWIIFHRDIALFQKEFPQWRVEIIQPLMPLVYLLSGGVSLRNLMPGWTYKIWRNLEKILDDGDRKFGMFALIVVRKIS